MNHSIHSIADSRFLDFEIAYRVAEQNPSLTTVFPGTCVFSGRPDLRISTFHADDFIAKVEAAQDVEVEGGSEAVRLREFEKQRQRWRA